MYGIIFVVCVIKYIACDEKLTDKKENIFFYLELLEN